MVDKNDGMGLRDRKRRATRRAILIAAIRVVAERGLEGTTVDGISRLADVSPRTFFNYFPSKEDAILGDPPELVADQAADFIEDRGPILEGMARVVSASAATGSNDPEVAILRKQIVKTHPELGMRRMARIQQFELDLIDLARRRLLHEHPELAADDRALTQRSRLVAFVSIAAMRDALSNWVDGRDDESNALADRMHESFTQLVTLVAPVAPA
jgi:AcrR family transcriptional regulator